MYLEIKDQFNQEANRWILWWPVGMGVGISSYFSLMYEPSLWMSVGGLGILSLLVWKCPRGKGIWLTFCALTLGFICAKGRTDWVNTVMIDQPLKGVVLHGAIQHVDYRHGRWRYEIGHIQSTYKGLPRRIRVNDPMVTRGIIPGMRVHLLVDLYPFPWPVRPMGFDFRRQAYFQGIGATGRVKHIYGIEPPQGWQGIASIRHKINQYFLTHLPPIPAALAMAFITGERGMIPEDIRQHFINAGLAHLLAISGLHLGLAVGVIFLITRYFLALFPWVGERWLIKKISAFLSIPWAASYLAISGVGIPAQRAYVMVSLMMLAIIMDRQAISMRLVAFAATLLLFFFPESLLNASFQLSFAAVIGLVSVYETKGESSLVTHTFQGLWNRWYSYFLKVMGTTLVASLATLPLTIYLFNRFTLVGVLGNMLAIPLMGFIIIPFLLLMVCCALWDGGSWVIWGVRWSLQSLVDLAEWCSQLPGANIEVSTPHPGFLWVTVLGGLWLCLWQRSWRYGGGVLMLVAPLFFIFPQPPIIYATMDGVGVVYPEAKRVELFSPKSFSFLKDQWRQDWMGFAVEPLSNPFVRYSSIVMIMGKISWKQARDACQTASLIITPNYFKCKLSQRNLPKIFDRNTFLDQGAIFVDKNQQTRGMKDICGKRPWTSKAS